MMTRYVILYAARWRVVCGTRKVESRFAQRALAVTINPNLSCNFDNLSFVVYQ